MKKLNWVLVESLLGSFGVGYAFFGFLEGYSSPTIAISFGFGLFMILIILGMAPAKT